MIERATLTSAQKSALPDIHNIPKVERPTIAATSSSNTTSNIIVPVSNVFRDASINSEIEDNFNKNIDDLQNLFLSLPFGNDFT